jgi:hypothetical protein
MQNLFECNGHNLLINYINSNDTGTARLDLRETLLKRTKNKALYDGIIDFIETHYSRQNVKNISNNVQNTLLNNACHKYFNIEYKYDMTNYSETNQYLIKQVLEPKVNNNYASKFKNAKIQLLHDNSYIHIAEAIRSDIIDPAQRLAKKVLEAKNYAEYLNAHEELKKFLEKHPSLSESFEDYQTIHIEKYLCDYNTDFKPLQDFFTFESKKNLPQAFSPLIKRVSQEQKKLVALRNQKAIDSYLNKPIGYQPTSNSTSKYAKVKAALNDLKNDFDAVVSKTDDCNKYNYSKKKLLEKCKEYGGSAGCEEYITFRLSERKLFDDKTKAAIAEGKKSELILFKESHPLYRESINASEPTNSQHIEKINKHQEKIISLLNKAEFVDAKRSYLGLINTFKMAGDQKYMWPQDTDVALNYTRAKNKLKTHLALMDIPWIKGLTMSNRDASKIRFNYLIEENRDWLADPNAHTMPDSIRQCGQEKIKKFLEECEKTSEELIKKTQENLKKTPPVITNLAQHQQDFDAIVRNSMHASPLLEKILDQQKKKFSKKIMDEVLSTISIWEIPAQFSTQFSQSILNSALNALNIYFQQHNNNNDIQQQIIEKLSKILEPYVLNPNDIALTFLTKARSLKLWIEISLSTRTEMVLLNDKEFDAKLDEIRQEISPDIKGISSLEALLESKIATVKENRSKMLHDVVGQILDGKEEAAQHKSKIIAEYNKQMLLGSVKDPLNTTGLDEDLKPKIVQYLALQVFCGKVPMSQGTVVGGDSITHLITDTQEYKKIKESFTKELIEYHYQKNNEKHSFYEKYQITEDNFKKTYDEFVELASKAFPISYIDINNSDAKNQILEEIKSGAYLAQQQKGELSLDQFTIKHPEYIGFAIALQKSESELKLQLQLKEAEEKKQEEKDLLEQDKTEGSVAIDIDRLSAYEPEDDDSINTVSVIDIKRPQKNVLQRFMAWLDSLISQKKEVGPKLPSDDEHCVIANKGSGEDRAIQSSRRSSVSSTGVVAGSVRSFAASMRRTPSFLGGVGDGTTFTPIETRTEHQAIADSDGIKGEQVAVNVMWKLVEMYSKSTDPTHQKLLCDYYKDYICQINVVNDRESIKKMTTVIEDNTQLYRTFFSGQIQTGFLGITQNFDAKSVAEKLLLFENLEIIVEMKRAYETRTSPLFQRDTTADTQTVMKNFLNYQCIWKPNATVELTDNVKIEDQVIEFGSAIAQCAGIGQNQGMSISQ